MGLTYVLDTSSLEENRGSFCYMPYYLFSYLKYEKKDGVFLIEDARVTQKTILDSIKPEDDVFISLWSYPQIDLCRLFSLRFPQAKFFGYTPLIEEEGLPLLDITPEMIATGIKNYANHIDSFQFLLLSDCDGHLKDRPEVLPLATSYGCSRGCSFCPVTPNLPEKNRIVIPIQDTINSLKVYEKTKPGAGIHFTDEDFFFDVDRAKKILSDYSVVTDNPSVIALASVDSFTRFLDSFEDDKEAFEFCAKTGLFLVEIGMETANTELAHRMGKPNFDKCITLAERMRDRVTKILWLSLTLSPGETLKSIQDTGYFLGEYGLNPEEMSPRIRTNGTVGGLGQFFQLYHGTRDYVKATLDGYSLTSRPSRLIPSYIPNSLLTDTIICLDAWRKEDLFWLDLYNVPALPFERDETVQACLSRWVREYNCPMYKGIIIIAIAARLGVIE